MLEPITKYELSIFSYKTFEVIVNCLLQLEDTRL